MKGAFLNVFLLTFSQLEAGKSVTFRRWPEAILLIQI